MRLPQHLSLALLFAFSAGFPPEAAAANPIDWEGIEALREMESATRLSCLLRVIDYWHGGDTQKLQITYDEEASLVRDDRGNVREMTPEEWKGIVLFVHTKAHRSDLDATLWRAFPNEYGLCGDDWGNVPRHVYEVQMLDRLILELATIRAIDGEGTEDSSAGELDVLEMREIPTGLYDVQLELPGEAQTVTLAVQNNRATFVESGSETLQGLSGEFELIGNGVFRTRLTGDNYRATQSWVFHPDGTASVKEVPDRGEKQTAKPAGGS